MKHLHKTLSSLRWEHGTGKRIEKCGLCSSRSKDYYNRPRICKYVHTHTDYYEHSLGVVIKVDVVFKLKYNICPTKNTEKSLTPNRQGLQNTLSQLQPNLQSPTEPSKCKALRPRPALPPSGNAMGQTDAGVHSIMKLYLRVALVIIASLTHMALVLGKKCDSRCAACWKDNNNDGVDIKFTCGSDYNCGDSCPSGYSRLHCAKWERC